ncbi:MAG: response regulator [Desulfobacterales bacterium]|nr:response regulator [Desulfobacterales bacterium]
MDVEENMQGSEVGPKDFHILVVDDEAAIRGMIQKSIEMTGYKCSMASDGEDALRVLSEDHVDLVLADINMPRMNGIELTGRIKDEYDADVIIMTGYIEDFRYEDVIEKGASDFVQKPVSIRELIMRINRVLKTRTLLSQRDVAEKELTQSLGRLKKSFEGIIQAMVKIIESRDPYTAGHQRKVSDLAHAIGVKMGFSRDHLDGLRMAGAIHDLGKMSVPAEILTKPGRLTDLEYSMMKTHPQVGYDILKDIEFPWAVADIVLQHHERLDGSGYPQGLREDEILQEARIIGVADVVEAMASHRPYRPALGIDIAREEISQNRGKIYDPDVVDACLALFESEEYLLE